MTESDRRVLTYARTLTPPPGWKVEVSGTTIVITASPSTTHAHTLWLVRSQLDAHCPTGLMPSENTDLVSPVIGALRNPDLTYFRFPLDESGGTEVPAEEAAIAVEIVSPSNPENDLVGKVRDYPLMDIPLYLVIDPRNGDITLYSEPSPTGYHRQWTGKFGDLVPIPAPFDFELATDTLLRYPD
ncbi:Uma2 family endonuclease [Kitasatospora sp. NPDC096140]|uniref:Uma2 family endonuclease n=1 Tax=Kitasatospora sp. NPDC096140 TaxID=3155425 RepID=UPI00332D1822